MFKLAIRFGGLAAAAVALSVTPLCYAQSGPQTLTDLIRAGQVDAVLAAITSPAVNVNVADPDGSTPLMWAVYKVDHQLVRALLKDGAKANVVNNYGSSPLTEAVKLADLDMVRMLLDAGADPNSPNQDGQTALMLASSLGAVDIAKLLIERGAAVNAVEVFRGQTALMWAAAESHPQIVELLLKHHADPNVRAKYDDWPRQMTSEPRAQFRPTGGLTALLYATRSGCYICAVDLVKAGADVNEPNPDGITPLINAIDNRSYDIAMFLLDHGANPNVWDMTGRTPLYVAVDLHSLRLGPGFGYGFGFGGPVWPHPKSKATALDLVNRLLSIGVDTNHQLTRMRPNGNGRGRFSDYMLRGGTAPLLVAAMRHDNVVVQALLKHGAEVDLPNVFRITPLMAAAGMSGTGGGFFGPRERDIQDRAIRTIDLLLNAGANINARVIGSHSHTATLVAYVHGVDHEGQTALFAAAESGWDKVVKHLLLRGADPSIRDDKGMTALDHARHPPRLRFGRLPPDPTLAARRAATVALLAAAQVPRSRPVADPVSDDK